MSGRPFFALEPLAADAASEVKCRRVCIVMPGFELGSEKRRRLQDRLVADGKHCLTKLWIVERRCWREETRVVVNARIHEYAAIGVARALAEVVDPTGGDLDRSDLRFIVSGKDRELCEEDERAQYPVAG